MTSEVVSAFVAQLVPDGDVAPPREVLGLPRATRSGRPVNLLAWSSPEQLSELARAQARGLPTVIVVERGARATALAPIVGSWGRGGALGTPVITIVLHPDDVTPPEWVLGGPDLVLGLASTEGAAGAARDGVASSAAALADLVDEILGVLCIGASSPRRGPDRGAAGMALSGLVPFDSGLQYPMEPVVRALVDDGRMVELRRPHAPELITAFANFRGRPIAIMAGRPDHNGGLITLAGVRRLGRFFRLVDALQVPIVSMAESKGMQWSPEPDTFETLFDALCTLYNLSAPKLAVLTGDLFGAAAALFGVTGMRFDYVAAWPRGRLAGEGEPHASSDPAFAAQSTALAMARDGGIVDLIHPDETYQLLCDFMQIVSSSDDQGVDGS